MLVFGDFNKMYTTSMPACLPLFLYFAQRTLMLLLFTPPCYGGPRMPPSSHLFFSFLKKKKKKQAGILYKEVHSFHLASFNENFMGLEKVISFAHFFLTETWPEISACFTAGEMLLLLSLLSPLLSPRPWSSS